MSLDALAKLDKVNAKKAGGWGQYDYDDDYLKEVRKKEKDLEKERVKHERAEKKRKSQKRRPDARLLAMPRYKKRRQGDDERRGENYERVSSL